MTDTMDQEPPLLARWLGYAGLLPFVGLAAAAWLTQAPVHAHVAMALLAYGAAILSFLGAIHWGLAMRESHSQIGGRQLLWGVIPSLGAWVALLLPPGDGLMLVAFGLWACFLVDRRAYPRFGLGAWLPMRLTLTTIASLACMAGAWGAGAHPAISCITQP